MSQEQHPQLPLPNFFSKFASGYATQTGHSTLKILAGIIADQIQRSDRPIGPHSVVHDTAAGPAIGAAAIVAAIDAADLPAEMLVSDSNAMMVQAARESLEFSTLPKVECRELDSQNLTGVPDNYFTHSINNFNIFAFLRPVDAVRETYRTLRPGGLALITCWSRFAPMHMVHTAQKAIRPDLPLMPTPSPEFFEDGVLQKVAEEAGFANDNIIVTRRELLVTDDVNRAGLTALMSGPMMAMARNGYTAEEEARWPEAVKKAVQQEFEEFGGIKFGAYVLLSVK
jgi:ubiquinone/menaquinone biosynthesis C-methylase UbiE